MQRCSFCVIRSIFGLCGASKCLFSDNFKLVLVIFLWCPKYDSVTIVPLLILQPGGKIQWDYSVFSVPIYLYDNSTKDRQAFLEYVCLIFLAINMLSELSGKLILLIKTNTCTIKLKTIFWFCRSVEGSQKV